MNLTISDIEKDIAGFLYRIQTAQNELASMPKGYLPFKQHKHREKQRRDCEATISHCKQLCVYAREGIEIRQTDKQ